MSRPVEREIAYQAIDDERDYQAQKWASTPTRGVDHSVAEFLVYMRSHVNEALEHVSRNPDPEASAHALHSVRKVAALAVATLERHGAPWRTR